MHPYFNAMPCKVSVCSKLWRIKYSLFRTWLQVLPYFLSCRADSRIDCRSLNISSLSMMPHYSWNCERLTFDTVDWKTKENEKQKKNRNYEKLRPNIYISLMMATLHEYHHCNCYYYCLLVSMVNSLYFIQPTIGEENYFFSTFTKHRLVDNTWKKKGRLTHSSFLSFNW